MADQENLSKSQAAGGTIEVSEFDNLLKKQFKPKSDTQKTAIERAVRTLAEQALAGTAVVSDDAVRTIESIIAEIDKKLTESVNAILHQADFQALEGAWRGLHHLVSKTETDDKLKIRVLNISKSELGKTIKKFKGTLWDQSPLFKKLYEEEFGSPGGQPYGAIVGDYHFDHTPPDVEILRGIAQIASAAHAPFITGAAPSVMNLSSWQELSNPRDISKLFTTAEYAAWNSLRQSEDARYLGLAMPRFLARQPYGAKSNPVEAFAFEEDTAGATHSKFTWANSAYAMASNITRAFKLYGWCARIRGAESGGMVEGLPVHTFPTDDGGVDMKCPTEIAITDRREAELAKGGFMPLSHWKNTDYGVFVGAQSLQKPQEYDDPDATANSNLAARLPYLFATTRFAHYLKCIVRDKIGSFKERADMQQWLNGWIRQFTVDSSASDEIKALKPLADAEVIIEEVDGNPGYYNSRFFLRPHYQLEGLTVSLRLVSKLPSAKNV
ncbi:MAG: type VI secretion system contractile sheath large subunit [Opitutus sp.]